MPFPITWQFGSSNPDNANHLATIQAWWANLSGKEIKWQQRLISANVAASELNWEPQRFDETFILAQSEIRGITLYWRKPGTTEERNATAQKLELDTLHQRLYIYPQSQSDVVIRVELPTIVFQSVELIDPEWHYQSVGDKHLFTFRDPAQKLEVKVSLKADSLAQLKQQLSTQS
jgi:hypothetical protein